MAQLKKYELDKVVHEVAEKKTPFLGICLGLQLLFESSEETPGVEGLHRQASRQGAPLTEEHSKHNYILDSTYNKDQ